MIDFCPFCSHAKSLHCFTPNGKIVCGYIVYVSDDGKEKKLCECDKCPPPYKKGDQV